MAAKANSADAVEEGRIRQKTTPIGASLKPYAGASQRQPI